MNVSNRYASLLNYKGREYIKIRLNHIPYVIQLDLNIGTIVIQPDLNIITVIHTDIRLLSK
jgi:hypothetical protein